MTYYTFLMKRVFKNKFTLILFLLITIFLGIIYSGNRAATFSSITDPLFSGENEIKALDQSIAQMVQNREQFDLESEQYKKISENINVAARRREMLSNRLNAYNHKNWHDYYMYNAQLSEQSLDAIQNTELNPEMDNTSIIPLIRLDINYYEYMMENNLAFDDRLASSQGISFFIKVLDQYYSFLFIMALTFICSKLCFLYKKDGKLKNIHVLLPIRLTRQRFIQSMTGLSAGIITMVFILLLCLICGIIGNSIGSINSPVLTYVDGLASYHSFYPLITPLLILMILSSIFIFLITAIVANFVNREVTCFFISLALLWGGSAILTTIVPLFPFMHLLPTTYLNSLKIVSFEFMHNMNNSAIVPLTGIIVLIISNIILFFGSCFFPKLKLTFWRQ